MLVVFSRWCVELCFQDEKTKLGFDHFESRSYVGLMRHQTITALTHLFLARAPGMAREKEPPELAIHQLWTVTAALIQSGQVSRRVSKRLRPRAADQIQATQRRKAASTKPPQMSPENA